MTRDATEVDRAYVEQYDELVKRNKALLEILRQMEGMGDDDERADSAE